MKLRKFISAAMAAAVILVSSAASVYAVGDGEATYCFDNGAALSGWTTFGLTDETGFTFKSSSAAAKNGNGSLLLSVKVQDNYTEGTGGAYINASDVGLDSFAGCTIEMSVRLANKDSGHYDRFSLFTDGMIWLEVPVEGLNEREWTDIVLKIPENATNNKVGFTIPTFNVYIGDVLYIDDFVVRDADGKIAANRGDYEVKKISAANMVPKSTNIILTIVLVVLIIGIIAGIGVFVASSMKRFH